MRGTLENPPIILEQDRFKLGLSLTATAGVTLLFAIKLSTGTGRSVFLDSFLILLFGVLSLFLVYSLFRPGCLILEPGGLTWRTGIRSFRYSWNDFTNFVIYSPRLFSRQPGCVYADGSQGNKIIRGLTGGIDSFGPCWNEPASEIVDLLNKARARWGISN